MIHNDLRDYIARAFGHSTFSFHEVFFDRPVMWFQKSDNLVSETGSLPYGTTQPFLSRFVFRSGLTPKVNPDTVASLLETAKGLVNNKRAWSKFDPLDIPLVATADDSFHRGLENLRFPLKHSIFLRGLLKIWLEIENGGKFSLRQWKGISDWDKIFEDNKAASQESGIPVTVGGIDASPASNCYVSVIGELNRAKIRKLYREAVKEELKRSIQETAQSGARPEEAALSLLREYHIALRPWIDADKSPVVIAVSISSNALFWGECVLILPAGANGRGLKSYEELVEILVRKIQSTFLPILTIFENYVLEREVKKSCGNWSKNGGIQDLTSAGPLLVPPTFLGFDKDWIDRNAHALQSVGMGYDPEFDLEAPPQINELCDHIFLSILSKCIEPRHVEQKPVKEADENKKEKEDGWNNRLNEIERALSSLWAARSSHPAIALENPEIDTAAFETMKKLFEESLVFENYLVASPAILKAIVSAMGLRHGERSTGKPSIKTALVIGGPGSGKDSMAKLVRLFSPGYRLGPLIVLNMASFRPKEAAVPLLLGLSIWDEPTRGHPEKPPNDPKTPTNNPERPPKNPEARLRWSIASLLGRAWAEHSDKEIPRTKKGEGLSFIFDELNSLDLDTQGALLRFLESGELLSLGDFKNPTQDVDALIVGVMNEDPNTITKVRTIDRIVKDKQVFGGLLGDFLYEFFRGKRRLRDDLYFRMARGGEIVMPELRQRREDIPLLFFLIVQKDLESSEHHEWEIELSAYELLMNPSLQWEGNVRELQALAREVVSIASTDHESQRRRGTIDTEVLTLRGTHVRSAIDSMTRKSQPTPEKLVEAT
jgi:hypothetical protein